MRAAELAGLVTGEDGKPKGIASSEAAQIAAIGIILDRAHGKAPQSITGEDGEGPPRVEITWLTSTAS